MDPIIRTEGLGRAFPIVGGDPFWALKDISIEIPEGKLTILRGKSGSGKTTLMNILSALDRPTTGTVFFDGMDLGNQSDKALGNLRRKNIGFVFQSVALIPVMTAYENVEFALRLAGSKRDNRKRVEECLKMVGLGARMTHMPQELSGGEQQRVAIARAMAHRPRVIFADEPTAELDTNTGLQVIKIFKELAAADGVTFVMTTHDTGLMEVGDAVIELEDGEQINAGK
jgi:putative ABC transport system ATP-binding protein